MVMNGRRPGAENADHGKNSKPSARSKSTERARRSQSMTAVRGRMEVSAAISARPNPTDDFAQADDRVLGRRFEHFAPGLWQRRGSSLHRD